MTTVAPRSTHQDPAVLLDRLGLGIAALAAVKFVAIWSLVHWDLSMSPWGFLVLFVPPFLIAHVLLPRRPRIGAVVAGIPAALLAVATAVAVVTGIEPVFMDYLVVFVAGPMALAAAVLAVRVGLWR
jgi:hypothetical protein